MLFGRAAVRTICLALAIGLSAPAVASGAPASPTDPLGSHVRGATPRINAMLQDGIKRSPTFARLVEELNRTNVVVYVALSHELPAGLDGRLTFMTTAGEVRYMQAQVLPTMSASEIISVVGHELQHAMEVAAHPEVRSAADLAALYARIGERGASRDRFDTPAARATGRRVRQELG